MVNPGNLKGKWKLENGLVAIITRDALIVNAQVYGWEGFIRVDNYDIYAVWDKFGHSIHNQPEYSLKKRFPEQADYAPRSKEFKDAS